MLSWGGCKLEDRGYLEAGVRVVRNIRGRLPSEQPLSSGQWQRGHGV
jgi:hypothetical protein